MMRQTTKFLNLDLGGITNAPGLVPNMVDNLIKIDAGVEAASEGTDISALKGRVSSLENAVGAIQAALAKTGESLTVEGLAGGLLTAGGYVAVADPEPEQDNQQDDNSR